MDSDQINFLSHHIMAEFDRLPLEQRRRLWETGGMFLDQAYYEARIEQEIKERREARARAVAMDESYLARPNRSRAVTKKESGKLVMVLKNRFGLV